MTIKLWYRIRNSEVNQYTPILHKFVRIFFIKCSRTAIKSAISLRSDLAQCLTHLCPVKILIAKKT